MAKLVALVEQASESSILMRVCTYSIVYLTLAGLNVPRAVLHTILAGSLFNTSNGTIVASFVSTLGALLAFLLNRHILSRSHADISLGESSSPVLGNSFHLAGWMPARIGAYGLLLMWPVPIVPFLVVNLLPEHSRLSAGTFWLVRQLGMLPATALLVHCGTALTNP